MARTKNGGNGRVDRLEEAMAALGQAQANMSQQQTTLEQAQVNLVQALANMAQNQTAMMQNQNAMAQQQIAILARMAETDARIAETNRLNSERFARIEAILLEHSRILRGLPEAVRDKIGFKSPLPRRSALGSRWRRPGPILFGLSCRGPRSE